ncbi:MAG: DUF86 domain-containing protein [Anaerolineales bacterium]|nr:DUF86 domain-containing protein [Anaerolineales bacterium]
MEWRAIAGMRDRLIHAYLVDYEIVWDVVLNKCPFCKPESRVLSRMKGRSWMLRSASN